MASFGHVAVGLLTGRLHRGGAPAGLPGSARCSWATLALFAGLAELPDADVLIVVLGASDAGAAGHRGASHSLCAAAIIGALVALIARRWGWPPWRTAIAATLAVASHGLIDAISEGGRGIPLLWPFTDARFISPWRLLPDAPRGMKFLSRHGLVDAVTEFLIFLPVTAYAVWQRRIAPAKLVVIEGAGAGLPRPAAIAAAPSDEREPPLRSSG